MFPANPRPSWRIGAIPLLCLFLALFAPVAGRAGERVALVIGNSDYRHLGALANPVRDAKAMAARLTGLGFTLFGANGKETGGPIHDLTQADFFRALGRFAERAGGTEMAFVYYAGHGIQIGGRSYLLPVDTPRDSVELVEARAIALDGKILRRLDGRARLTIAVFDACREIPELEEAMTRSRSGGFGSVMNRGLSVVESRSTGRIVAYSAAAGQLAADGEDGGHSPYTALLLEQLDTNPGQSVESLFARVAFEFRRRYPGQQPELLNQGVEPNRYFFKPAPRVTGGDSAGPAAGNPAMMEITFWETARGKDSVAMYEAYLARYPNGGFVELARIRIEELESTGAGGPRPLAAAIPTGDDVAGNRYSEPPGRSARLVVRSNVFDDTVTIDGRAMGPTGPGAHELAPGEYTVRVEKAGYAPFETRVTLAAGEEETVWARLRLARAAPSVEEKELAPMDWDGRRPLPRPLRPLRPLPPRMAPLEKELSPMDWHERRPLHRPLPRGRRVGPPEAPDRK